MAVFSNEPVLEVPLSQGPLVKVVVQVQYSRSPWLLTEAAEEILLRRWRTTRFAAEVSSTS